MMMMMMMRAKIVYNLLLIQVELVCVRVWYVQLKHRYLKVYMIKSCRTIPLWHCHVKSLAFLFLSARGSRTDNWSAQRIWCVNASHLLVDCDCNSVSLNSSSAWLTNTTIFVTDRRRDGHIGHSKGITVMCLRIMQRGALTVKDLFALGINKLQHVSSWVCPVI